MILASKITATGLACALYSVRVDRSFVTSRNQDSFSQVVSTLPPLLKTNTMTADDSERCFFEEDLDSWGFQESHCHKCGIHNSELAGLLMQCGKCKKAYYCSMKCFNSDMDRHSKFCQTSTLDKEPERSDWEGFKKKPNPIQLSIEKAGEGMHRLVAVCTDPLVITAKDLKTGFMFKGMEDNTLFKYTKADDNRQDVLAHPGAGVVRDLYGSGTMEITATNKKTKNKEKVTVKPVEPAAPYIKLKKVDKQKNIYKIQIVELSGEPVDVRFTDGDDEVYGSMDEKSLFRYISGPHRSCPSSDEKHGSFSQLIGPGKLTITATNKAGKSSSVTVKPSEASPPKLTIEDLGDGLHRINATDVDTDEPVEVEAVDSKGNPFILKPGTVLRYVEAGDGGCKQTEASDPTYGSVQNIRGSGEMKVTAINSAGKKTSASLKPNEASAPNISLEDLGDGLYKLHASDDSGEPVKVDAVDKNGQKFSVPPGTVFRYTDAGNADGGQTKGNDGENLRGHGDLTLTATNPAGKSSGITVSPAEASAPNLKVEDLGDGVKKIVATDDSGDPVIIKIEDANGKPFNGSPDTIFSYVDAGNGANKQSTEKHPRHGDLEKMRGHGPLTVTATNSAGKETKVNVSPTEASAPKIHIEDLGKGVKKLHVTDESGEPVTVKGVDSAGHPFTMEPGTVFKYVECGAGESKQASENDPNHGAVQVMRGNGDMKLTATNTAGKEATATVRPTEAGAPTLNIQDLGNGLHKIVASDESGEPLELTAKDANGKPFSVSPGTVFSYVDAGNGSGKQESVSDPKHGDIQKIRGSGDLVVTAKNPAGKTAQATVSPSEAAPPKLVIEDLGNGLRKIVASDESGDPVTIEAVDSNGKTFDVKPGTVFSYADAGPSSGKQSQEDDDKYGPIEKLHGHGDLILKAKNSAGKESTAKVAPTEAAPPQLTVKDLGKGIRELVASDDSGEPVEISCKDSNGMTFEVKLEPGSKFIYNDAGGATPMEKMTDTNRGSLPSLYGNGDLVVTGTNVAGKTATVNVSPTAAPAPNIEVKEIGPGVYQVHASDESGKPVTIEAKDDDGSPFKHMNPGTIFRYTEAGSDDNIQHIITDPTHGDIQDISGQGKLQLTAKNPFGATATASVEPDEAEPPNLELQEIEPGLHRVVASDPTGGPVTVDAVDGDNKIIDSALHSGSILQYVKGDTPSCARQNSPYGPVHDFVAPELYVVCTNKKGKKAKRKVPPTRKKRVWKMGDDGLYEVPDTKLEHEVRPKRELTVEIADKLIFWYGRLGHPNQETMRRKVAHLPKSCGITVDDVDLLPWIIRGSVLNTKKLHDIIAELDEKKKDGDDGE